MRVYKDGYGGKQIMADIWADTPDDKESKKTSKNTSKKKKADPLKRIDEISKNLEGVSDVKLIAKTMVFKTNTPKKKPDVMELNIGGDIQAKLDYAKEIIGKEINITDVFDENEFVDVTSVTKGKGFQGVVKRFGVRKQPAKATKKRRHIGSGGSWKPARKLWMEPQPGQMGYNTRTEYNKLILKIGDDGGEITPSGGFLRYGPVSGNYLMLYGSIPGPAKRVVRLTRQRRRHSEVSYSIKHIDLTSKQGL